MYWSLICAQHCARYWEESSEWERHPGPWPSLLSTVERQAVSRGHNAVGAYGEVRYRVDSYCIFVTLHPDPSRSFLFPPYCKSWWESGPAWHKGPEGQSLLKKTKAARGGPMIQAVNCGRLPETLNQDQMSLETSFAYWPGKLQGLMGVVTPLS